MKEKVKETADGMFEQYLKLMKLDPEQMAPGQEVETRRAFNGALGMILVLVKESHIRYRGNPKQLNRVLNDLQKELWKYWRGQGAGNIFDAKY